jgi:hypothetical protein
MNDLKVKGYNSSTYKYAKTSPKRIPQLARVVNIKRILKINTLINSFLSAFWLITSLWTT